MISKGFKFGMLLQFAIGPVTIFIFQIGSLRGFPMAFTGVLGVTIIDGLYILAAILGIASIIERKSAKIYLKIFGAIILFVFGTSTILSVFNIYILPAFSLDSLNNSNSALIRALILTASNPFTILFWAGVFSVKLAEEKMNPKDVYTFGFGALLPTIFVKSLVALAGSLTKTFFPLHLIQTFNLIVGLLLVYFSIRMIFKKV